MTTDLAFVLLTAFALVAVSANDGKVMLVDGVNTPRPDPQPDTVTILDVSGATPRVIAELKAPTSMVENEIQMFGFDGKSLKPAGAMNVKGGPAGIRTAR